MASMLLIRNGSMIVLIGIFPRFFPGHTTTPTDSTAETSFAGREVEPKPNCEATAAAFDAPAVLNFMDSRPVAQLVRALP